MDATAGSLITAFDYVWGRLTGRLTGLTDEEYFWEPVAGCWSLRQGDDRRWHLDGGGAGGPAPEPVPVTTIAWRLGHLGGTAVGGFCNRLFGDGTLTTEQIAFPSRAAAVSGFLDEHYRGWRAGLAELSPAGRGHPSRCRGRLAQRPLLPPLLAAQLKRPPKTRMKTAQGGCAAPKPRIKA